MEFYEWCFENPVRLPDEIGKVLVTGEIGSGNPPCICARRRGTFWQGIDPRGFAGLWPSIGMMTDTLCLRKETQTNVCNPIEAKVNNSTTIQEETI